MPLPRMGIGTRSQRYYLGKECNGILRAHFQKKGILGPIIAKICWPMTRTSIHCMDEEASHKVSTLCQPEKGANRVRRAPNGFSCGAFSWSPRVLPNQPEGADTHATHALSLSHGHRY